MDGESRRHDNLESILQDRNSEPCGLSLEYLRKITNDFSDKQLLGEGGFGKVFKGVLQNGKMVAVKKLVKLKPGVQEKQFENEVYHLIRLKHPNIVRFVGYCYETWNECIEFNGRYIFAETKQRLLCLEYLSHGSLDGHLSDESSGLDWETRYKIIKGICCGIHYLHEECQCQINGSIIHLDLKPANILLDDNMVPKVADFGLSRLFKTCTTNLAGTFGYMAPEYIYGHVITTKADIYSLGVLIVEIIMGDRIDPFNFNSATSCEDFVEAVLKKWRNRSKAAPSEADCKQIECCLEIGLSCVKVNRNERPTIKEIMERLNKWESANCYINNNDEDTPPADKPVQRQRMWRRGRLLASIVSKALFELMLPHRNEAVCQAGGFYTYEAFIAAAGAFNGFGTTGDVVTRKREIAAFLGQTSYETSGRWLTATNDPYSWGYCYKQETSGAMDRRLADYRDASSSQYPSAPGKYYYGRGPFQLSYNFNYGQAGKAIAVDLLNDPDLVITDPTVSFKTAIWFWMTVKPPMPSCHAAITGQWTPSGADLAAGRAPGYGVTTNIINGQLECGKPRDSRVAERIGFYKRYCDILAVSYGENLDCYQRPFNAEQS